MSEISLVDSRLISTTVAPETDAMSSRSAVGEASRSVPTTKKTGALDDPHCDGQAVGAHRTSKENNIWDQRTSAYGTTR